MGEALHSLVMRNHQDAQPLMRVAMPQMAIGRWSTASMSMRCGTRAADGTISSLQAPSTLEQPSWLSMTASHCRYTYAAAQEDPLPGDIGLIDTSGWSEPRQIRLERPVHFVWRACVRDVYAIAIHSA